MRNVQDMKDASLATLGALGFALVAGITFAAASTPAEPPVAPTTSVVDATESVNTSGGSIMKSNISGGTLTNK